MRKRFEINPDTRMNSFQVKIRLNDFGSRASGRRSLIRVMFEFGGINNFAFLSSLVEFLDEAKYSTYDFVVRFGTDRLALPVAQDSNHFIGNPPIQITSMQRGSVVNSVKAFNYTLAFSIEYRNFHRLVSFLYSHRDKDLTYEIIRVSTRKRTALPP